MIMIMEVLTAPRRKSNCAADLLCCNAYNATGAA